MTYQPRIWRKRLLAYPLAAMLVADASAFAGGGVDDAPPPKSETLLQRLLTIVKVGDALEHLENFGVIEFTAGAPLMGSLEKGAETAGHMAIQHGETTVNTIKGIPAAPLRTWDPVSGMPGADAPQ